MFALWIRSIEYKACLLVSLTHLLRSKLLRSFAFCRTQSLAHLLSLELMGNEIIPVNLPNTHVLRMITMSHFLFHSRLIHTTTVAGAANFSATSASTIELFHKWLSHFLSPRFRMSWTKMSHLLLAILTFSFIWPSIKNHWPRGASKHIETGDNEKT